MKNVIFVGPSKQGSCNMRGVQIVHSLEKHFNTKTTYQLNNIFNDINEIRDSVIVFVGEPIFIAGGVDNLVTLKKNGNSLIYDVIDNFCFTHTNILHNTDLIHIYQHLDVLIHTNSLSKYQSELLLPKQHHVIIPHNWDIGNEELQYDIPGNIHTACYIGGLQGFTLDKEKLQGYVDIYDNPFDPNNQHSKYAFHASFRGKEFMDRYYKPCTKLAVASSFGAILLTSRDQSVVDIVGECYEFYVEDENEIKNKIDRIRGMGEQELKLYRDSTQLIKEYLSPKQTAKRYLELIKLYT